MKRLLLTLLIAISAFNLSSGQTASYVYYDVVPANGNGVRFWSGDNWKIHMGNIPEYHYGPVTDYSIKMNMDATSGRGWTWGAPGGTPVAALGNQGNMQIAGTFQSNNLKAWAGNSSNIFTSTQLQFSWGGGNGNVSYAHALKTRHNSLGLSGNAIDFYLWQPGDNSSGEGSLNVMSLNGGYVGIGASSPASKLHISSADRHQALRVYMDGNTANYLSVGQGSGGAVIDPIGTGLLYLGYDQSSNVIMGYGGGSVGIGNMGTPSSMLHINSPVERQTFRLYKSGNSNNYLSVWQGTGAGAIDPIGTGKLYLGYDQITDTYVNGKLGIGTTNPDYPLTVNGSVHAKEVRVDLSVPGPDYVFEKDYKLTSLEDLKNYIDQNKHLPEVPSAKEMEKNGVQLGEMNMILLKKIEELTLYAIEQNKRLSNLEAENRELKNLLKK